MPLAVRGYEARAASDTGTFRVGVGKADITPPPGYPTGGHGPAGTLARGHWGRLEARTFFFQDAEGQRLVLVSVDTFAIPSGLRLEVARRAGLPPDAVLVAATHTHHGPGNYLTCATYNQFGSAYSGFSHDLFEFLAARIAKAVLTAEASLRPAMLRVHTGNAATDYAQSFLRNRSPGVFSLNLDREDLLNALRLAPIAACASHRKPGELTSDWDIPGCPRLAAVDQGLTVLEARDAAGTAFAWLVFLAVHPTVLVHGAPLNSPDFVGWAMAALERRCNGCVVGFFNGAQGDITARRTSRDLRDVRTVGTELVRAIEGVVSTPPRDLEPVPKIVVRRKEVRPDSQDRYCSREGDRLELAKEPLFGAAGFGGAEDDRTIFHELGWREGVRTRPRHHQGPKLGALDSSLFPLLRLTKVLGPPEGFPKELPVSRIDIGRSFSIAGLPVEMSTTEGWRLRNALGAPHGQLEIVGLADEYSSYTASPEEYVAQDYMGASTIWGPEEGPFLRCVVAAARPRSTSAAQRVPARWFRPGPPPIEGPFGPVFAGDRRSRPDEELEKVLRHSDGLPARRLPWFAWTEETTPDRDDFACMARRVIVEDALGRILATDEDLELLVVLMEGTRTGSRSYAAIWLSPLWGPFPQEARFRVRGPCMKEERRSKAFAIATAMAGDAPVAPE